MKTINKNFVNLKSENIFDICESLVSLSNDGATVIVPHVCNNANAFGAGFAGAVAKRYPIVKENYHLLGSKFLKNNLGYTQFIIVKHNEKYNHRLIFANMIAQNGTISNHNRRPLNYYALCKTMHGVTNYIENNFDNTNNVQIHAPKFGSGLAGGNWLFIQELIRDIWHNHPVYIHHNK
jgi:hypothetical protein